MTVFQSRDYSSRTAERQLTTAPHGHILTNANVWSPDGEWIVYDVRSDPAGDVFDGTRIEMVHVDSGEVRRLYESRAGACCGVATFSPVEHKVVFIHGPEQPTADWPYCAWHRRGVVIDASGVAVGCAANHSLPATLDARNLVPPFTPGALRGGTHLHFYSPDGQWIAFTYEDHLLATLPPETPDADLNQRNVGIAVPGPITVPKSHPRNHDGSHTSVLVTRTLNQPRRGSDEICRASEETWIGINGYVRADGSRQRRALAFQGEVVTAAGRTIREVFVVDLPDDPIQPGDGPLAGTLARRPFPPRGVIQRRITYTADRKHPGLSGPRHWLRTGPDGSEIAFLMRDEAGIVQLWTVSPYGGEPRQRTHNEHDIASAFTWSPDGRSIAHVMNGSVCLTDSGTGQTRRLTARYPPETSPQPEACVFSTDGRNIAYVRPMPSKEDKGGILNQIFVASVPAATGVA